jgi:hypothetical protein
VMVAGELDQALDHIPLAISQAAAYIQSESPRMSLQQYLDELRKNDCRRWTLLKHESPDLGREHETSNAVLTIWSMSFSKVQSMRPSAANMPALTSFFDGQHIPWWMLLAQDADFRNALTDGATLQRISKSDACPWAVVHVREATQVPGCRAAFTMCIGNL